MLYIFIFLHQTTTAIALQKYKERLYIFIFLHQTTTSMVNVTLPSALYIFIFLHQTTTLSTSLSLGVSCISLYSYIKPQPRLVKGQCPPVVYLYIPTSNHNASVWGLPISVLYIFIFLHQTTTAGLNAFLGDVLYIFIFLHQTTTIITAIAGFFGLYIFIFLHQTTTHARNEQAASSCISLYSYIKPQQSYSHY